MNTLTTLTYLACDARVASLQALIERERAVRLAHLHTGSDEDLLELYRRSDAAADAAGDAWIKLLLACQAADAIKLLLACEAADAKEAGRG